MTLKLRCKHCRQPITHRAHQNGVEQALKLPIWVADEPCTAERHENLILERGRTYRLTEPIDTVGNYNRRKWQPGQVFRYVDTVDYLDWFARIIAIDGQEYRVGYGLPEYCEEIPA